MNNTKFLNWKTIKIGTFKSAVELEEALLVGKSLKEDFAKNMIRSYNFSINKNERELNLVIISPKELGFESNVSYNKICKTAFQLGLKLCPDETGPQICLQSNDLNKNNFLVIGMESIFIPITKEPCIFYLAQNKKNKILLNGRWGRPEGVWINSSPFVFCY